MKLNYNTRRGVSQPVTFSSTGVKPKPVLDEGGFQQLLAAAYVLQQHNDSLRAKDPRLDAAWIFAQISETETLVRQSGLRLRDAAQRVGERLCKMTGAVSTTVCLLLDGRVDCVAESGVAAQTMGRSIAANSLVAEERLKNGRQFQSLDAQADSRLDTALCRELGVRSLLAVPIQTLDQTKGLIEVRWGLANAIHECDVRTCRLMAGLLAEVLERDAPSPNIESEVVPRRALVESEDPLLAEHAPGGNPASDAPDLKGAESLVDLARECRVCGRPFSSDEAFCGHCSMPRVAASANNDGLQSKWASMWFMQQAQEAPPERRSGGSKFLPSASLIRKTSIAPPLKPSEAPLHRPEVPSPLASPPLLRPAARPEPSFVTHSLRPEPLPLSNSANSTEIGESGLEHTLRILEDDSLGDSGPQASPSLVSRLRPLVSFRIKIGRKAVALALCSVVMLLFLATWLSWPDKSSTHLSWFESMLVDLGLAEVQSRHPSPAPVFAGDPNVRVWEDVHTALYYCPDSDLYGKTPGGRFSTQRSAQEDQFEPATRVACQ